jgi:hypothetical protein
MQLRIRNPQDFWSGILFISLGALAIYLSKNHDMGSALVIGALSFKIEGDDNQGLALGEWAFRPWLVLTATLVLFALLMEAEIGFVPSLIVLIVGCALAHQDVRWRETVVLSIFVTAGCVAIFSYGLGLPYRLFWWSP